MTVILDRLLWFPKDTVNLARLRQELTVHTTPFQGPPQTLVMLEEKDEYVGVPRAWGLKQQWLIQGKPIQDDTTNPYLKWPQFNGKYRTGQKESVEAIINAFAADNKYGALLEAKTGTGKTVIATIIASLLNTPTLVLVHKEDLAEQWSMLLNGGIKEGKQVDPMFPGARSGHVQGDKWNYHDCHLVTAMAQTLYSRRDKTPPDFYSQFGAVVYDECFTGDTQIDGQAIATICRGDVITGGDGYPDNVVQVYKSKPSQLVRLTFSDGRRLVCTPDHPIFCLELNQYVPAKDMENRHGCSRDDLYKLRQDFRDLYKIYQEDVFSPMPTGSERSSGQGIGKVFGGVQSKIRVRTNDQEQSDVESGYEGEDGVFFKGTPYYQSRGQRARSHGYGDSIREGTTHRFYDGYLSNNTSGIFTQSLQVGHSIVSSQDFDRGGRLFSRYFKGAESRQAKDCFNRKFRVASVEVLKSTSNGSFGGVCQDGYVYNLKTERSHTYWANGLLVHNCHRYPAKTFEAVMRLCPARYRYGVSATWRRKDGLDHVWHWHIGSIEHRTRGLHLIGQYVQVPWNTNVSDRMFRRGSYLNTAAYITSIAENAPYNVWLTDELIKGAEAGRQVLLCSHRTAQLSDIRERILQRGRPVTVGYYAGKVDGKKITKEELEVTKTCNIILATFAKMSEGTDIATLDTLFLATPASDVEQVVGRIQRVQSDKRSLLIVDPVWQTNYNMRMSNKRESIYRKLGFTRQGEKDA